MYVSAMGATFKGPSTSPSLFFQTFTIEPMRSKSHTYWISYTYTDCLSDSRAAVLSHLQDLGFYSFIVYQ
jgi:hypothetical protein